MIKPLVNPLHGLKVIEDKSLTIPDGTIIITRPWKERLFTRPWKPWIATKEIFNIIPDPAIYMIRLGSKFQRRARVALAHPVTVRRLYDELGQIEEKRNHGT